MIEYSKEMRETGYYHDYSLPLDFSASPNSSDIKNDTESFSITQDLFKEGKYILVLKIKNDNDLLYLFFRKDIYNNKIKYIFK